MTVRELREKLAKLDDNVEILIDDSEWGCEEMKGFFFTDDDVIVFTSENASYLK